MYDSIGDCSGIGNNLARSRLESLGIAFIYIIGCNA